ncbi:MAG: hypothetical protein GWP17_01990 [Aquificales bacterium]|nr:hypothetical protein [Aquificales bacterium]
MTLKETTNSVSHAVVGIVRQTWLFGIGVASVLVENGAEVIGNAGPYSEKLIERGEQTSKDFNDALNIRRQEIRQR